MKKRYQKIFTYFSIISLLLQIGSGVFLARPISAEETSPTPTPTITESPSPSPTPSVEPTPSLEQTPTVTTIPTVEITPTIEVIPTTEVTPTVVVTPTIEVEPSIAATPTVEVSPVAEVTPIVVATPTTEATSTMETTPTPTPTATPTPEVLGSTAVEETVQVVIMPSLLTNKNDYSPTDVAEITGQGFLPLTTYTLLITADSLSQTFLVTTDLSGSFKYDYQLDGIYRPRYKVEVKDQTGTILATITFTDANPSADLDQYGNDAPAGWQNGNLNDTQATYFEGDSVPYRMKFSNLDTSASHAVTIEWDTTKSGKHAIDYLTSFNRTVVTANPCDGVSGCSGFTTFPIPKDPQVDNGSGIPITQIAGSFTLYGGSITTVDSYTYPEGSGFSGDTSARIVIHFTTTAANPVLAWGGHIATRANWGNLNSAVAISGSPYHTRLIDLDGKGGNQDRSLSADAVIFPGSITIVKNSVPNNAQDFGYTATGGLSPATFSLDDDGDPTLSNTQAYSNLLVTANNGNNYTITEGSVSGWTLSFNDPVCTVTSANGGSQSVLDSTVSINLREGEKVSCTFINTLQQGHLTVIKHVINDNGGTAIASDFTMNVTGTNVSDPSFPGAESPGTTVDLNAGSYSVTESGPSGYSESDSADCSGTIAAGENKTCTITNDDQAATLTVIKHVVNNNGGTAAAGDFTMNVAGSSPSPASFPGTESPGTDVTINAGAYSVSETGPSGYTESDSLDCSGSLALGQHKTCTITNNDQAAHLIVIKHVINDNGGTAVAGDFTMNVTATNPSDASFPGVETTGTTITLDAGSYSVAETGPAGYAESDSADCSGTIAVGETKTCTITNDDIQPKLTLTKFVINDDGGNKQVSDFPLFVDATSVTSGVQNGFDAGTYTASETQQTGYAASGWSGDCAAGGSVTLAVGDDKTCEITNDDIPPRLTIVKDARPNDCEDFTFGGGLGAFILDDDQGVQDCTDTNRPQSKLFDNILANHSYTITETIPNSFWEFGGVSCVATGTEAPYDFTNATNGLTINLNLADDVTCTFRNNKLGPTRTLGFWQTHTTYTSSVFAANFAGGMQIGSAPHKGLITNTSSAGQSQLFGAFYSSIPKKSDGKTKRTPLDQTRMQLLQQLVAAKLNCAAFGCPASIQTLITQADTIYAGSDKSAILNKAGLLGNYNNSGDTIIIGSVGSATPKTSQELANKVFWDTP